MNTAVVNKQTIRDLLEQRGMTYANLARAASVSRTTIRKIAISERLSTHDETAYAIAKALNVTIDQINWLGVKFGAIGGCLPGTVYGSYKKMSEQEHMCGQHFIVLPPNGRCQDFCM